jgi:uncharacterized membrane protein YkvA (DUF1232 family)
MPMNFARVRTLLGEVPRTARLAYCLLRDERVPAAPKAALAAALGIIVSPFDVPAWVPVFGELDMLALGVLAVKVFVDACPEELVDEHKAALKSHTSAFDEDWAAARTEAGDMLAGVVRRMAGRSAGAARRIRVLRDQMEDRSA